MPLRRSYGRSDGLLHPRRRRWGRRHGIRGGTMKLKRPSPAMAVALVALVMSMTGGAIAAVNYARNAGKVVGYDAVKAASSNRKAAGRLVATDEFGRFPAKFLSGVARTQRGSQ